MPTLAAILLDTSRRNKVVEDFAHLVDTEVQSKGGLSGIAVKAAFAIVKKVKPGIVPEVVDRLAGDFANRLDPFYQAHSVGGAATDFAAYMSSRAGEVAQALLSITDARAQSSDNRTLRGAYDKLRPMGIKHVEAAVPGIARIIKAYI